MLFQKTVTSIRQDAGYPISLGPHCLKLPAGSNVKHKEMFFYKLYQGESLTNLVDLKQKEMFPTVDDPLSPVTVHGQDVVAVTHVVVQLVVVGDDMWVTEHLRGKSVNKSISNFN